MAKLMFPLKVVTEPHRIATMPSHSPRNKIFEPLVIERDSKNSSHVHVIKEFLEKLNIPLPRNRTGKFNNFCVDNIILRGNQLPIRARGDPRIRPNLNGFSITNTLEITSFKSCNICKNTLPGTRGACLGAGTKDIAIGVVFRS
jgi:hypothetical protein